MNTKSSDKILGCDANTLPPAAPGAPEPQDLASRWAEDAQDALDTWTHLRALVRSTVDWQAADLPEAAFDLLARWKAVERLAPAFRSKYDDLLEALQQVVDRDRGVLVAAALRCADGDGWHQALQLWVSELEQPGSDGLALARQARELVDELDSAELVVAAVESIEPGAGEGLEQELAPCFEGLGEHAEALAIAAPVFVAMAKTFDPELDRRDPLLAVTGDKFLTLVRASVGLHAAELEASPVLSQGEIEFWRRQAAKYTYAIVHAGQAHRDEALALGLAYATGLLPIDAPVHRREPTEAELEDPEILVLDVGRRHEPAKGNFDHHQLPRGERECALSLLARHLGLDVIFNTRPWYQATVTIDALGPFTMAKELGLPELPKGLVSPFDMAILDAMGECDQLPAWISALLKMTMERRLADARALALRAEWLDANHAVYPVAGIHVLVVPDDDAMGIGELRQRLNQDIAVSVSWDDRGPGWSLYRFDDDPRVDFSKLSGDPDVGFAHANGFIAKTRERLAQIDVMALVARAVG